MKSIRLKQLVGLILLGFGSIACNLSAGAAESIAPTAQPLIITATPQEHLVTQTPASTIQTQNTNASTTVTSSVSGQSASTSNNQADNLYYVNSSKPSSVICAVQATVTSNIRNSKSTSATIVGQLLGGAWIGVTNHSNGWYQIDAPNTPVNRLFISDGPTELDSGCRCDANGCTRTQSNPTGQSSDSSIYLVTQAFPIPPDVCAVYPVGDYSVNIRDGQSENSKILGRLSAGSWIQVRHFTNGWFGVVRPGTIVDGAYIASGPTQLSGNCQCTATSCQIRVGNPRCILYGDERSKVYQEPGNWTEQVGQLVAGTAYRATVQSNNGWYNLENGGWVMQSFLTFDPETSCADLPVITYNPPVITCKLKNTTGEIQPILREPDGDYFGRFGINLEMGIISRNDNWFQVYVDAFSNAGWVDGTDMEVTGACISQ